MTNTTILATRALSGLVDTARALSDRARAQGDPKTAFGLLNISVTLDAARTRLVQDGPEYLEAAWAFTRAGRAMIADYKTLMMDADRARA